ncbi:MAG: protein kinase domain-containing protein [Planctomycetota bacterium]|jgi:serine/threonine protein kinase
MMDITCQTCGTLYHLSPAHTAGKHHCHLCRAPLPSAKSASAMGAAHQSGTFFVVCAFCQHNFSIPLGAIAETTPCENCGKEVNLNCSGVTGDTTNINLGETLAPFMTTEVESSANSFSPVADSISDILDDGMTLAGYRQGGPIGHTPLGTIFEGEQLALQRKVALYHLHSELAAEQERLSIFLEEARRAAGLVHPNIARVYDVQSTEEHHFIVSEMVQGKSLENRINDKEFLSLEELIAVGTQAAQALTVAHQAGFHHCGISPANLVLNAAGEVRVLHFGIGRAITTGSIPARIRTQKSLLLLLAPEQLLRLPTDARTDIFSLGATLYVALTGALPYNVVEIQQVIQRRSIPRPPDIHHICPDIPRSLAELLRKMLQIRPDDRPESAATVARLLEAVQTGMDEEEGPREATPPPSATSSRRTRVLPRAEKRRYRRFHTDMNVEITNAELPLKEQAAHLQRLGDLSENGAFILSDAPLPINSFLRLNFALEGSSARVNVLGLVRWHDPTPGRTGMGVQFLEVSTEDRSHINRFVDTRSASELLKELTATHLHKAILKYVIAHWGETVPLQKIMQGTGAGRTLFEQVLQNFREAGLVAASGDQVTCLRPESDALCECLLQALTTLR